MSKAILTCALNGVLTDPRQHPMVPVTPEQMAQSAREAFDVGASIIHVHFRCQLPGMGHLPNWEPDVAAEAVDAIRSACPGVIINQSTGVIGADISGPVACLKRTRPEIAACNAGSLNYLKLRADKQWAWPPLLFDNPVSKVKAFLDAMAESGSQAGIRVLRCGHRPIRRPVCRERHGGSGAIQFCDGGRLGDARRWRSPRFAFEISPKRCAMANDADRPDGDLAGPPARRRPGRNVAHRA